MNDSDYYKSIALLLSVLLLLTMLLAEVRRRDTENKMVRLNAEIKTLHQEADVMADIITDVERRVTRFESRFWE